MDIVKVDDPAIQNPLIWADRCRTSASLETNSEAKAALLQLAEEFEAIIAEFEGLVSGFKAVASRGGG